MSDRDPKDAADPRLALLDQQIAATRASHAAQEARHKAELAAATERSFAFSKGFACHSKLLVAYCSVLHWDLPSIGSLGTRLGHFLGLVCLALPEASQTWCVRQSNSAVVPPRSVHWTVCPFRACHLDRGRHSSVVIY